MKDQASPLFSVVIPTYNHGCYLGRALKSVLDQTYTNWEVIVIDNHSTDNTDEVVAGFSCSQITYLKINNNGVIAASRNAGICVSKGDWVAFLDSDDWWTNDKLQTCFNTINNDVDLIYHDLEIITEQPRPLRRKILKSWQVKAPVLKDLLVKGNPIANSSVIVRKSLLDKISGIDESVEMVAAEDYNTWLRIAELTNQFAYLSQKLGYYLIHDQSVSKKDMLLPARSAVNKFLHILTDRQKNKLEASFRYASGKHNYRVGDLLSSKDKFFFSLKYGYNFIRLKSLIMLLFINFKL
jgi:glycosyltransferase involved in cell wall biosynthesis